MNRPAKPIQTPNPRFAALRDRAEAVGAVTATTRQHGEAASSAPSQNILTAPAENQRSAFPFRMLQRHRLILEQQQIRIWETTGRKPTLQGLLDQGTGVLAYVYSETNIPQEAEAYGISVAELVIRRLKGER